MSDARPAYLVSEENRKAFEDCKNEILSLMEDSDAIPYELIMRLLLLIGANGDHPIWMIKRRDRINKANLKVPLYLNEILSYFAASQAKNDYWFEGEIKRPIYQLNSDPSKKSLTKQRDTIPYSFEKLLDYCIWEYIIMSDCHSKKEAVIEFLNLINSYMDSAVGKADQKKITPYKRNVLAGYLAQIVSGFKLIESGKAFSNASMYQAVRNALSNKK